MYESAPMPQVRPHSNSGGCARETGAPHGLLACPARPRTTEI